MDENLEKDVKEVLTAVEQKVEENMKETIKTNEITKTVEDLMRKKGVDPEKTDPHTFLQSISNEEPQQVQPDNTSKELSFMYNAGIKQPEFDKLTALAEQDGVNLLNLKQDSPVLKAYMGELNKEKDVSVEQTDKVIGKQPATNPQAKQNGDRVSFIKKAFIGN